jgi:hypothetical protein
VQIRVGGFPEVARAKRRGPGFRPDSRVRLAARERAVLLQRLSELAPAVRFVAAALAVGRAAAGHADQRRGKGAPDHVPVRPSIAR